MLLRLRENAQDVIISVQELVILEMFLCASVVGPVFNF